MTVYRITKDIALVDVEPPIPGFEKQLGTYVLKAQKVAIIDGGPASSLNHLYEGLRELGIQPADVKYILASHIHLDHTGGAGTAIKQMPEAKIVVHEKGRPHLADPSRLWESSLLVTGETTNLYGRPERVPESRMITASEGMKIDLGDMQLEVLLTPGHATHHLCFFDRARANLFVGEAAGIYTMDMDLVRPAAPIPFNLEQAVNSLDKLINLDPQNLFYANFGWSGDAVNKLRRYKQQLLLWGQIIADNLNVQNWLAIYEKLKAQDESLEYIKKLSPAKCQVEFSYIGNNIRGYQEYFKKNGTDYLRLITNAQI